MHRLWVRIAVNGGIAAIMLAMLGLIFAEMAGAMLANTNPANAANRGQGGAELTPAELRVRVPLMMAAGGALVVAVGELLLFLIRGNPPQKKKTAPPQDDAEKLLDELLKQVEDAEKAKQAGTSPTETELPKS